MHKHGSFGLGFLDCGAYAVRTGSWDKFPVEDYLAFSSYHQNKFRLVAMPDVIGDADKTYAIHRYFLKHTDIAPERLLSVFHVFSPDEYGTSRKKFERVMSLSLEAGVGTFALGGIASVKSLSEDRRIVLGETMKWLEPYRDRIKVHFFGVSDGAVLTRYKPESCDSASALRTGLTLTVRALDVFGNRGLKLRELPPENWSIRQKAANLFFQRCREIVEEALGVDEEGLHEIFCGLHESDVTIMLNWAESLRYQRILREMIGNGFTYYTTVGRRPDANKSEFFQLCMFLLRDRFLESYSTWHTDSDGGIDRFSRAWRDAETYRGLF